MKIGISTDSSCLINYEMLKKYEISLFPLNVIINEKEFLDGVTINQDELYIAMKNKKIVKTSTPPLGVIIQYFEEMFKKGYEKIIHFTISSKLSSMYNLFESVSENYFDHRIVVIDSYSLSTVMLSHVLFAYEEVKMNSPLEEIVKNIEIRKNKDYLCFIPENLVALKNGGRISPAIAAIGNTIGLKPIILLKDGSLEKDSMVRLVKKAFDLKLQMLIEEYPPAEYDYCIINFYGNEKIVKYVEDAAKKYINGNRIVSGIIPINVCAHCGPGTIGLIVSSKINGKSINEFL